MLDDNENKLPYWFILLVVAGLFIIKITGLYDILKGN